MAVSLEGTYVGFCRDAGQGVARTLFRMPEGFGELAPPGTPGRGGEPALAIGPQLPVTQDRSMQYEPVAALVVKQVKEEREEVMRWARVNGVYLYLGPCESVQPLVAELFGPGVVASFAQLGPLAESDPLPALLAGDVPTDTLALTGTLALSGTAGMSGTVLLAPLSAEEQAALEAAAAAAGIDPAAPSAAAPAPQPVGQYVLTTAGPSGGCGGNYIAGVVVDLAGAPVAGVRVVAADRYGNSWETVSKDGAGDYGRFDVTVAGNENTYYVTLVDAGGTAISPTAVIAHVQPQEGNACYWVQFQAGVF